MKKMIKYVAAIAAAVIPSVYQVTSAQDYEPYNFSDLSTPSAETFQISKYGNVKPSMYTGAMEYQLPIYCYSDPDFNMPVSLDYHFDGYRPAQHSGIVGYGWALSCGGVITREIRGIPDETHPADIDPQYGYFKYVTRNRPQNDNWLILNGSVNGLSPKIIDNDNAVEFNVFSDMPFHVSENHPNDKYDCCADIFHFSFMGHGGDFMMMEDGTFKVFNSTDPYGEISIDFDDSMMFSSGYWQAPACQFTITTGDGFRFVFGGTLPSTEYSLTFCNDVITSTIAAWKLRSIIAPNGRTMSINYADSWQTAISVPFSYTPDVICTGSYHTISFSNYNSEKIKSVCTKIWSNPLSIYVDGSMVVEFGYTGKAIDECDAAYFEGNIPHLHDIPTIFYTHQQSPQMLSSVAIRNNSGVLVDSLTLSHHIAMNKVFLSSANSRRYGRHTFTYNTVLPYPPKNNTSAVDYWGYYNGMETLDVRSTLSINELESGSAYEQHDIESMDPDPVKTSKAALTAITYPTGGNTTIEYEGNDAYYFLDRSSESFPYLRRNTMGYGAGGVRVKRMVNNSSERRDTVAFYYRSSMTDTSSSGIVFDNPCYGHRIQYIYRARVYDEDLHQAYYTRLLLNADGYTKDCNNLQNSNPHIGYRDVIVKHPDGSMTGYAFSTIAEYPDSYSRSAVTAYTKTFVDGYDRIYPSDQFDAEEQLRNLYYALLPPVSDMGCMRGKLLSETEYSPEGNVKRRTQYNYQSRQVCSSDAVYNMLIVFARIPLREYQCMKTLERTTIYEENGSHYTETRYLYNDWGQISSTTVSGTGSNSYTTNIQYCHETAGSTSVPDSRRSAVQRITDLKMDAATLDQNIISIKEYGYGNVISNPFPTSVTETRDGSSRITTVTYNSKFRPTRIYHTGGRYTEYSWSADGRTILSSTSNAVGNTTAYQWRDLIGLSGISLPDGRSEHYSYDSRNRLSARQDSDGNMTVSYYYHLENE